MHLCSVPLSRKLYCNVCGLNGADKKADPAVPGEARLTCCEVSSVVKSWCLQAELVSVGGVGGDARNLPEALQ